MKNGYGIFCGTLAVAALLFSACQSGQTVVSNMRLEHQTSPIGIDAAQPRFSWNYEGKSSFVQGKYQLSVATEKSHLGKDWQSPVVASADMLTKPMEGLNLRAHTHYYWQLTAWDAATGKKVTSPVAEFETAKLAQSDWTAQWISDANDKDFAGVPVLQKTFTLTKAPRTARIYMSAAAYGMLKVNGERLCSASLNPGYTHYDKRNLYMTYDVTKLLKKGENTVTAILGNGFYNEIERTGVWDFEKARWRGRARMICEVRITNADGTVTVINSDPTWKTTTDGPYVRNNIYSGDTYDARKEDMSGANWQQAKTIDAPSPVLTAQQMGAVTVDKVYQPKAVKAFGDSVYVFDFGTNMSGYCRLKVKGPAGTRVTVQHGELLQPDGRLEMRNISLYYYRVPGLECQTDVYVLDGKDDVLQPEFNYHGFRYVEVKTDHPLNLSAANAEGLFIHTAMEQIGSFSCSDASLNRIWEMVNQSYLCNFMSIPTDCPQREKNGWTADAHISSDIALLNYDGITAYEKWLDDICDNQEKDGQITGIIPSSSWGFNIGPVWDAVAFVIPMQLYLYYGDTKYVTRMIPVCERYLNYLKTKETEEGTINYGLGDWVPYKTQTPNEYTSTCYYYLEALYLARFKKIAGQDASVYEQKAEKLKQIINRKFFNAETGLYSNGSETAQGLALWLEIVPEAYERTVAANLSRLIHESNDHLDFGMIGSKTVLRMLAKYGLVDQAVDMALKKDAPSWANWIEEGYTTPIETWILSPDFRDASANHVFLGDINAWMYNCLAGINYDRERPGFQHAIIEPHFPKQLTWVNASYRSAAGLIKSSWKREAGGISVDLTLPVNTSATVILGGKKEEVKAGSHHFFVAQ